MQSLLKKNALQKRQLPPRESFVLIRARTDASLPNYLVVVASLLYVVMVCVSLLHGLVLLIFNGTASIIWNAFLQTWPQVLLGIAGASENRNDPSVTVVYLWVILWSFFFFLLWFVIKLTRDLYGLCRASWVQGSGDAPIAVSKHLRVYHAPWLSQSITDASSPTALLDLLQQGNDWCQVLAEILEHAPQEKRPPVTILISLSDHLVVSIMGQDGKREPVKFKSSSWNAVLAFFALQNKGEWIPRKTIETKVYGAEHGDLLALHTSRINAKVNKKAKDSGFFDESILEEEESGNLDLFEQDRSDPRHLWRLSPRCEVEVFSDLTALHEQVLAARSGQISLHREVLRRRCHQVIELYGQGLLAEHQEPPCVWPWLQDTYMRFRDQLCSILDYAASHEWQMAQLQTHSDLAEYQNAIWYSARFSGFHAQIALGIASLPDAGEPALIRSLERYYLLKDINGASSVYQAYVKKMLERDSRWIPRLKILEIWPEVTMREREKKRMSKE